MRKIYMLLLTVCFAAAVNAQSSANYTFAVSSTASLTDMSTGTTQLVAPSQDDVASVITNTGFDFWYMGTRYTQFSASSNGFVRLGGTAVGTTQYTLGSAAIPLIASLGSDLQVSATGKVHYKITGSAPNRVLIIEFKNMTIIYDGLAVLTDGTSQVRLYEGTNAIELVYGAMNRNNSTGFSAANNPQYMGFSLNSTANTFATVNTADVAVTSGTPTANLFPMNTAMASLNSVADGSRKMYTFTPTGAAAPTALNFTTVTAVGMTLNWTDNSTDEVGFAIYRSTDGVNYSFVATTAANAVSSVQGGLTPSTNYFWKVYAIREALSLQLANSQVTNAAASIVSTGAGGLWNTPGTWAGGVVPTAGDNVTIADGATVTIDLPAAVAYNLTIGQGVSGVLDYQATPAASLTIGNDITVATGGTFTAGGGALATHTLSMAGNLTNNGTLDLFTTAAVTLTFTGTTNSSFTGAGATTDLYILALAKAARAQEVELNLTNFSVRGLSAAATGALLTSNTGTGTLKISGSNTFSGVLWSAAGYTIPSTLGFWLNNPNFTVNGQNGSPTNSGLFRVTQGTYNIGTATGNSMGFSTGSTTIVEGGAVNATGRFGVAAAANVITYTQSGGTITVCTIGNASATLASFDLGTSNASTILVSGGTIICQLASTGTTQIDYRMQAGGGFTSLTGGTLQLGNAASGAAKTFVFRGLLPLNTVITNTSGNHSLTLPATAPATYVYGVQHLTINTGNTFTNLQTGTNPEFFVGNVINNGTFTSTSAGNRVYNVGLIGATTWSGSGVFTAGIPSFEIDNAAGVTLSTTNQIPTNRIILFTGAFVNTNKFTLGNGGTTTGTVQIGNTTTPTAAGVFDFAPTFNLGSGGQVIAYLRTTASRVTGPEVGPTRALTSLSYDDNDITHTLTVAGGNISATTLNLTNGVVVTDAANVVTATGTTAASVTRTTGYVSGPLRRTLPASLLTGSTYLFPVGRSAYKPFELVNATTNAGGTVVIEAEQFDGATGGTAGTGMLSINTNAYWHSAITAGGGNFTSTTIRLTDGAGLASSDAIARSATQTGAYDFAGGNSVNTPVNTITSDVTATFGYLVMGIKTPPACNVPSAVNITAITTSTANVNFNCVACSGTYIVEYGAPGFVPGTGGVAGGGIVVTGAGSPIPISGLSANTTYDVYVRQDCGAGSYSTNSTVVTFTTLCVATSVPYTENFDAVTPPAVPSCTVVQDVNGGTTWITQTTNSRSAPNNLSYIFNVPLPGDDWWFTRGLNLTGGTSYRLVFWYRARSSTFPEALEVKYGTAQNAASMTLGTLFTNASISTTTYTQASIDFTPASSGVYYIGFHDISAPDEWNLHVDDISVDATPLCPPPTSLTIGSITTNSGTATWSGSGTFILEYGLTGFTPGTGATAGVGGTLINPAVSAQVIGGLAASTSYDVYVRQDCSGLGNGYSTNLGPVSFTTLTPPPANDDAPGAVSLTVGSGCAGNPFTNANATQSALEPFAACKGSAGFRTVWYSFSAPSSGAVKISNDFSGGTMGDSRMALFTTTDVNDYSRFTNIACDDDNGATVGLRSILYATGLTAGTTYYIQVDVFDISTTAGTFCLSVDELSSSMLSASTTCAAGQSLSLYNNNYGGWISATDASGNLMALIQNNTGGAGTSTFDNSMNINAAAVRQDAVSGQFYLDRNYRITNSSVTNANVRFFFLNTELSALQAVDAGVSLSNLQVTRQTGAACQNNFVAASGTNSSLPQVTNGGGAGYSWVQATTTGFSNFFLNTMRTYVPVRTWLSGAYSTGLARHKDVTATWAAVLNASALNQPYNVAAFGNYAGTENVTAGFFTSTAATTDIVDWVLLELHDATTPSIIITRRAAFIREDGRIVEVDGTTDASFRSLTPGNYFVVIRHRNHLGIRTAATQTVDGTLGVAIPSVYDFSTAQAQAFQDPAITGLPAPNNNGAMRDVGAGVFGMWGGNGNLNTTVRASGPLAQNDYGFLFTTTLGGDVTLIIPNVYHNADYNMDGQVRANGPLAQNDYLFLVSTILGNDINRIVTQHQ